MKLLADATRGAVEGFVGGVGRIIDDLHTSDEEREQAKHQAEQLAQQTFAILVGAAEAELSAKKDVLVAELQQGDAYTKRARPTLVYAGLAFIAMNYVVFPLIGRLTAIGRLLLAEKFDPMVAQAMAELAQPLADLPTDFWLAWGGVTGTWVLGRSLERGGVVAGALDRLTPKR